MRFGILGPVQAWDGDRPLRVGGRREQKLLAMLLVHVRQSVSVARLTAAIWGDEAPPTADAQLRNTVAALRRNLVVAGNGHVPLDRTDAGLVLHVGDEQLDAARFHQLVDAAERRAAAGAVADAADDLRTALGLWRGPALGGIDAGPLGAEARRLEEERLACVERRMALDLELGRHAEVASELAALTALHPLRERLVELRMLALYRDGRRQDALEVYAGARRALTEETGLDPRPELVRLHQAILRADAALDGPAEPLRPPVRTPSADPPRGPAQLPADVAGFTGRQEELAALDLLVAERASGSRPHAMAAIVGPAGVGKTALAVHWAHRISTRYPDGQLYIDLHGFGHDRELAPLAALGRLLRALGQPDATLAAGLDERAAQYRSLLAGRQMVLLLDNAASAEQVRPLLPGAGPHVTLVTSRHRLDGLVVHEGVRSMELAELTDDEAAELVRATAALDDKDADALAALVHLCDRLPLALRIAAARLAAQPSQSVAALVAELADEQRRLSALSLACGDAAVRTAFASSYQHLTPPAARLLRGLALHNGPEPSLAVCAWARGLSRPGAGELLDELVARHVVMRVAPERYRMHDLIRLYARERAEAEEPADERAAVQQRMLDWYLAAADAGDQALRPYRISPFPAPTVPDGAPSFTDENAVLAWFDLESANLSAAVAAAEHTHPATCWRLAAVMHAWFERRHRRAEWHEVASMGLRAAAAVDDPPGEAAMRQSLGVCLVYSDRHADAIEEFQRAVAIRRRVGEPKPLAWALGNLGNQYARAGRDGEATAYLTECLTMLESLGERTLTGIALNNLGWAHYRAGRFVPAIDCYRRAAAIAREVHDAQAASFAEGNLAIVYAKKHRHRDALRRWQRALRAAQLAGDRRLEANSWAGVARARLALGDSGARDDLERALAIYLEIDAVTDVEDIRDLLAVTTAGGS
jgi:DNA-binding SARP family transcriptional activator